MKMTQRIISTLLAVVMLLGMVPVMPARAASPAGIGDGWGNWSDYVIDSSVVTYAVSGGNLYFGHESYMDQESMDYEIYLLSADSTIIQADVPANVNGLVVTTIGTAAFADCSRLTSLSLPGTLTSIGDFPFLRCNSLTEIRMENPGMNYSVVDGVLYHAYDTTQNDLCKYPSGCTEQVYVIEEGTTSISAFAFENAKLATIYIPESVTYIDSSAFTGCTLLTDLHYAGSALQWNNIRIMGGNECLTGAQIHYNSEPYDTVGGFCGQNVIWELTQDGTLTISGSGPMDNYYEGDDEVAPWLEENIEVTNVVFEGNVTTVGQNAFVGTSARTIYISSGVNEVFSGMEWIDTLEKIIVNPENQKFCSDEAGVLYTKDKTGLIVAPTKLSGSYEVPDETTVINWSAFNGCTNLKEIHLPDTITTIGQGAFAYCSELESVRIPEALTSIDYYVFNECVNLKSVYIPESVTSIGFFAFGNSSIEVVHYGGTEAQWNQIQIDENGNDSLRTATIRYGGVGDNTVYDLILEEYKQAMLMDSDEVQMDDFPNINQWIMMYYHLSEGDMEFQYAYYDIDGNGTDELLVGQRSSIIGLYANNGASPVVLENRTGDRSHAAIYTDGTILIWGSEGAAVSRHTFYRLDEFGYRMSLEKEFYFDGNHYSDSTLDRMREEYNNYVRDLVEVEEFDWMPLIPNQPDNYRLEISPAENLTVGIGQSLQIICHLYNGDELVTEWEPPSVSTSHIAGEAELSYSDWIEWEDGYLLMVTGAGSVAGNTELTLHHEDTGATLEIPIEVVTKCGENLTWVLSPDGILTISGTGDMYDYSEDTSAPWPLDIKAVVLENGVTSIGEGAFCYSDLEIISLGDSLLEIGDAAFIGCDNLKYIAIKSPLTEIGFMAFSGCLELISVALPDTVTQIGEFAFDQCRALREAYYGGTEEQWNLVSVGDHNECLTRVINFEGLFGVVIDTELVNQSNTYANYTISAIITNNSVNIALTNVLCAFDPGASATITSGEGAQTESALAPQQSKKYTWTIQIDRSNYADGGVHYVTVTVDTDQTLTPSFRGAIALDAVNAQGNELDFSEDVWNFHNISEDKIDPNSESSPRHPHKITEADKNALLADLDASSRAIAESMLSEGSNGHCFGMSLTTILSKMNVYNISDYENVSTLRQASLTDRVWSILCYYQLLQNFDSYSGFRQSFKDSNTTRRKLEILAEKADMVKSGGCPVILDYGCDGWGGHSVVAYALEQGSWRYHGKTYNRRILTYDSNAANGGIALFNPIWNEDCCLYFNEGSDEWIIPAYYPNTVSTNPKASIWCVCNDLNVLDIKNYNAGINNYRAELRLRSETAIQITGNGKRYVVNGKSGDISGDGELASYYSTEVISADGNVGTRHIVLPDEDANYTIITLSGSSAELDFSVLYDDKYVGITSSAADVSFSENGDLCVSGNEGDFALTIADDNIPEGEFNTYTVRGSATGNITVSVSNQGITVTGDNLNGVTIEASEGDTVDTVTITNNTDEITLERNGDELIEDNLVPPAITGSWTTDLVMSAADLGVSAPDSVLRATFAFNEDGTATTTWEAVDLTAFRIFFHDMFVNAYYAMAYGAGITDLNEIEAFCRESTGMSVSDYMDTLVTDEAMRSAFTPASTSGVYRLNEEQNGLYTDMAIMDVQSDPDEENSFVIGNGTMYLNAASYGKPEYTFVCTRVE